MLITSNAFQATFFVREGVYHEWERQFHISKWSCVQYNLGKYMTMIVDEVDFSFVFNNPSHCHIDNMASWVMIVVAFLY